MSKLYNIEVYRAKSYYVHMIGVKELADEFITHTEITDERVNTNLLSLLNPTLVEILRDKVIQAIKRVIKNSLELTDLLPEEEQEALLLAITTKKIIPKNPTFIKRYIEKLLGIDLCYSFNSMYRETTLIDKLISYNLSSILYIIPDANTELTWDETIHSGRVSKTSILFPIWNYNVKVDQRTYTLDKLYKNDTCSFNVYRMLNEVGKLYNTKEFYSRIYSTTPASALDAGLPVHRDFWTGKIIIQEGIKRLEGRFVRTTCLNTVKKKKPRVKSKTRKLSVASISYIESVLKNTLTENIENSKVLKKLLKDNYRVDVSLKEPLFYRPTYTIINTRLYNNVETWSLKCLALIEMMSPRTKRKAMLRLVNQSVVHYHYILIKESWIACEDKNVKELSIFLDKCLKIKPLKGEKDVRKTERDASASDDSRDSASINQSRRPVGIVVRTASGYSGFCGRESSSLQTGRNTCNNNSTES